MIFSIKEKMIILTRTMFIFFIIATNIPQWLKTGFKVQGNVI